MKPRALTSRYSKPNAPTSLASLGDSFPVKVYRLVLFLHTNHPEIACFHTGKGSGFVVKDAKKIASHLRDFKVCLASGEGGTPQFSSFHRQLNKYGFNKCNKPKDNEMLYSHEENWFQMGDICSLSKIKIKPAPKKGNVPTGGNEMIDEINELKVELVAVQTKLLEMGQKSDDQYTKMMGLLHFIAGSTSGHMLQGAPLPPWANGSKRARRGDPLSDDCSHSTSLTLSVTDTATASAASTTGVDPSDAESMKSIAGHASSAVQDQKMATASANPLAGRRTNAEITDLDIDMDLASDDDLFDDLFNPVTIGTLQHILSKDDSGSLLTENTPHSTEPPSAVAPKAFLSARQSSRSKKNTHKRSGGGSSSSYASTISSLSAEGTIGSMGMGRPSHLHLVTARDNDVLFGNGDFSCHAGNQRHASLVSEKKSTYLRATVHAKDEICTAIVKNTKRHGGLFLEEASSSSSGSGHRGKASWRELTEEMAKQQTALSFVQKGAQEHSDLSSSSGDDEGNGSGGMGSEPGNSGGDEDPNRRSGNGSSGQGSGGSDRSSSSGDKSGDGNGGSVPTATASVCVVPSTADSSALGEPAPDEPAPDEPAPDEPAPGEPAPGEPAPGEPAATSSSTPPEVGSSSQEHDGQEEELTLLLESSESASRSTSDYHEGSTSFESPTDSELFELEANELTSSMSRSCERLYQEDTLEERILEEGERSVTFSHISVRKYPMVLGDHPVCSSGPPVTIGWEFKAEAPVDVDDYESSRPERRRPWDLIMSPGYRKKILTKKAGHTEWEIREAVHDVNEVKRQRQRSVRGLPFVQLRDAIQSTEKQFRRLRIDKNRRKSSKKELHPRNVDVVSCDSSGIRHRDSVALLQSKVR